MSQDQTILTKMKRKTMTREIVSREAFLKPVERRKEDVPLPELGNGTVIPVWGMTVRERNAFEARSNRNKTTRRQTREQIVIACCRDDDGKPIFTEADVAQLGDQQAAMVERIINVAMRLSGFTEDDVEQLAKN